MNAPRAATPPPPNYLLATCVVLLAVLAGAAGWFYYELEMVETENARLLAERSMAAREGVPEASLAEVRQLRGQVADLEKQLAAMSDATLAAMYALSEGPGGDAGNLSAARLLAMLEDPETRQAMNARVERQVQTVFADLIDHYQFAPAQRAAFLRLLVDKQMNQAEFSLKLLNPRLARDQRDRLMKSLAEANHTADARVRDFLPDAAAFGYFQAYLQEQPERFEVSALQRRLQAIDSPLTMEQADALAALMYEERRNFPFSYNYYDQSKLDPGSLLEHHVETFLEEEAQLRTRVAERAAAVLTPERMTVFKANQEAIRQNIKRQWDMTAQFLSAAAVPPEETPKTE